MNWKQSLQQLPPEACFVEHQPLTPRYERAANRLEYLLENALVLGVREADGHHTGCIEIAVWAPEPARRGDGYYACFRVTLVDREPCFAVLYCFYDGRDRTPGFRSSDAAQAYSLSQGFRDDIRDHHRA